MAEQACFYEEADASAPPYRQGTIVSEDASGSLTVQPAPSGKRVQRRRDQVFARSDTPAGGVPDNAQLAHLHEASLLHNLTQRYADDNIYTYVGSVLVALNPYKSIAGLYEQDSMDSYRGRALGVMPPHVYAIADRAYRLCVVDRRDRLARLRDELGEEELFERHPEARGYLRPDDGYRLFEQREALLARLDEAVSARAAELAAGCSYPLA